MTDKDKVRIYRALAVVGLLVAIVLAFAFPYEQREPDSWAYRYAIENFADGKLSIDDALHQQQVREAQEQGGWLAQYVQIDNDKWVLEKTPGDVFFVVPFEWLGIPRAANVVLAIGLAFVTYLVMRRLAGEAAACLASLLMLVTPVSLIMLHRSYMAMFGASAFLALGAGAAPVNGVILATLSLTGAPLLLADGTGIAGSPLADTSILPKHLANPTLEIDVPLRGL